MADVKMSDVKAGDTIEIDGGFECASAGLRTVLANEDDELYFTCCLGKHYLEGQLDFEESDVLAGIIGHTPQPAVVS